MIAIDWGTSNFRAFLINKDGEVIDRRSSPHGILQVAAGDFASVLQAQVTEWLAMGERHILLSGMVGSRQGWIEAPYLPCPAGVDDFAGAMVKVPFSTAEVLLVPGVNGVDSDGVPEVMRGEEMEAMGVLEACGGSGLLCLPGTHSKWITLHNQKIVSFSTCMTGEVFSVLSKHTILARTMALDLPIEKEAFLRGVERSANSGGLLHHLFSVRTLILAGQLKEESSKSYLSGLLIGHELRSAMQPKTHVHLVGAPALCSLYMQAIEACGGSSTLAEADAAVRGLVAIGRRLSWI